ncbi:MAG: hypothetical protein NTU72_11750 [Fimbriimonadales bacterium]|nr:hypothetical protein [Fimbriimonadales bacterium]
MNVEMDMHTIQPTFAVIYKWKLKAGTEVSFIEAWKQMTIALRERGSLGSRLHKSHDGYWIAYAPSMKSRPSASKWPTSPADISARMQECVSESFEETRLELVSDLLLNQHNS